MISGMYLGEIVRRVLQRMAEESDIFPDAVQNLSVPFVIRYDIDKVCSRPMCKIVTCNFSLFLVFLW